ncbi:MAG: hypothetical protein ABIX10_16525 [Acidimicrobiales bacterium]
MGLVGMSLGATSTSAAPTVQDNRFLTAGSVDVVYTCTGADPATQSLFAAIFPGGMFTLDANITTLAVEPSPSPGEEFDLEFTWNFTLGPALVATSVDLAVEQLNVTGTERIGVSSGVTGPDSVGTDGPTPVVIGDGSVAVGYTHGPIGDGGYTSTFTRTAAVDEALVFAPGNVTSTVVTSPSGISLSIACTPDGSLLTLTDQDGVAPVTTTTTRPAVVTTTTVAGGTGGATSTTVAGGSRAGAAQLPRTGSSNLIMVMVAIALIDVGYLALTAGRPARSWRAPSVH